MARVLGRIRISRLTDESTSLERQRELIQNWADQNGHEVVAWAEDADVSGSISPFDAPDLGKYLTEEGSRGWDMLVSWKIDRLARNAINMSRLFIWIQDNDKQLVCISDNIDLSSWAGRMVANVIAGVAEGELEAIRERVTAGKRAVRKQGRFQGGIAPFGYKSVAREGGGRELVKDPEQQKTLQWIFEQALKNRPLAHIAADLNSGGVDSIRAEFKGKKTQGWHPTTIATILNNKAYLGWTMYKGKPVLDDNGEPVKRCEPSISIEDFNRIQELWSKRTLRTQKPAKISPLQGVIVCWDCGKNMSYRRQQPETSNSYYCRYHDYPISVNGPVAEQRLEEQFRGLIADLPILEKRVSVISSTEDDLEAAKLNYKALIGELAVAPDAETRELISHQAGIVRRRMEELQAATSTADGVEWIDTGVTFGERWDALDTEGRRLLMTSAGIKYRVNQLKGGTRWGPAIQESELIVPEELQLAARSKGFNLHEIEQQQRQQWWESLTEEERRSWLDSGLEAPGSEEVENA